MARARNVKAGRVIFLLQSLIGWVSFSGQHAVEMTANGHASSKINPTSKARTGSRIIPRRSICSRREALILVCWTKGLGTGGGKKDAWRGTMGGRSPASPTPEPGTVAATAAASAHRFMMDPGARPEQSGDPKRAAEFTVPTSEPETPSPRRRSRLLRRRQSHLATSCPALRDAPRALAPPPRNLLLEHTSWIPIYRLSDPDQPLSSGPCCLSSGSLSR